MKILYKDLLELIREAKEVYAKNPTEENELKLEVLQEKMDSTIKRGKR